MLVKFNNHLMNYCRDYDYYFYSLVRMKIIYSDLEINKRILCINKSFIDMTIYYHNYNNKFVKYIYVDKYKLYVSTIFFPNWEISTERNNKVFLDYYDTLKETITHN